MFWVITRWGGGGLETQCEANMSTVLKTLASSVCVCAICKESSARVVVKLHLANIMVSASYDYLVLTLPNQSSFSLKLSAVNIPIEASIVCAVEAYKGLEERNWFSYWVNLFEGTDSQAIIQGELVWASFCRFRLRIPMS